MVLEVRYLGTSYYGPYARAHIVHYRDVLGMFSFGQLLLGN